MKRLFIATIAIVACFAAAHATELLMFTPTNYQDWVYNNPSYPIDGDNITHNHINLFRDGETDYVLLSPQFSCQGIDTLTVDLVGITYFYYTSEFSPLKSSPTVELLDEQGNVLMSVYHKVSTAELDRSFYTEFDIKELSQRENLTLRFACWKANTYSALSVRRIIVNGKEASSTVAGDVNGDGVCNSSDVTALYQFILNNDSSKIVNGDQNDDQTINSSDVTAVYKIILGN
jgi:hypothetical protein